MHSPEHVHDLLNCQEYILLLKDSTLPSPHTPIYMIFQLYLLSILIRLCFASLVITASGICGVKQLLLIIFDNCPEEKGSLYE